MKPAPWSHTALDTFKTCPRQFHAKYVLKSIKEPPSKEMLWGREVHKHFEDRLNGVPLPTELEQHEPYLKKLADAPGILFTEQKIALDTKAKPCGYFDRDVWYRGAIDVKVVDPEKAFATIVDHKTGRPHQKFEQLATFAVHTFIQHPNVNTILGQYYWTQTGGTSQKYWVREDIPVLWKYVLPDLKQYRQAFELDIWQPRQSGLCNGWCPVKECEFWRPKKDRDSR